MATMEDAVFVLVTEHPVFTAQAGERLYPVDFPQAPTYPAATYIVPSRIHDYHMEGPSGLRKARVQFDVYGETWDACVALGDAVIEVLGGFKGMVDVLPVEDGDPTETVEVQGIFCIIDRDVTESGTRTSGPKVRRRLIEFTIWV